MSFIPSLGCCLALSISLFHSTASSEEKSVKRGPIHIGSKFKTKEKAFLEAAADFAAVVEGKAPVFAKRASSSALILDGGTRAYYGTGYLVKVQQTGGRLFGVDGFFYGPTITFDKSLVAGVEDKISRIEFYSTEELKKLKNGRLD